MRAPETRAATGTRQPTEPYPGLRPFLDYEAALLFGRERQVREVIERLKQTQFVAVLGGSGSGKSSLIHAGVTPELRSFGIPGAGDFWVTMTCTPGTNVRAAPDSVREHTPVTRLAWKFAALLRSRGSEAADEARLAEIADVFRQEAGFARLMETYVDELAVPPGPDPKEARLLFVIDQFEELFHPTNSGVDDAQRLVERVIDHFFDPHPHAFVVLTMRSEHLNDCARYLELPDAINSASYLIRRLDADELRQAIVQPAQRFLRLCARSGDIAGLPEEVQFDEPGKPERLLKRLLRDVGDITHDPDHLPLLQHLLARLWQAARLREGTGVPVPARITMDDLVMAVCAGKATTLDDKANTLRDSLENWAEAVFPHDDASRARGLHALLRQLAFKDPNTGMYTQQRVDVDDAPALLGPGKTRDDVHALVADGYLGAVNYLFWDDEDPSRVTLKVSHESFIRGWRRFRKIIDAESERFAEFLAVLRKCAAWAARGRPDTLLLAEDDLARLRDARLQQMLTTLAEREAWFRMLMLDRDGARLAPMEPEIDAYVALSAQRQERHAKARNTSRRLWRAAVVIGLVVLPLAGFSVFVQAPVARRAELMFEAGNLATNAPLPVSFTTRDDGLQGLGMLVEAARLFDEARTGNSFMTRTSEQLLRSLDWVPAVRRQAGLLGGVAALVEPSINSQLRSTMAAWLWPAGAARGRPVPLIPARTMRCESGEAGPAGSYEGQLFTSRGESGNGPLRAIFVPGRPTLAADEVTLQLMVALVNDDGTWCRATKTLMAIPARLRPRIAFDAALRFFMYTQGLNPGENDPPEGVAVTVQEMDWQLQPDGSSEMTGWRPRAVVLNPEAVAAVRSAVGDARAAFVPTYRVSAGRLFQLGDGHWEIGSTSAQRVDVDDKKGPLAPLQQASEASPCPALQSMRSQRPGFASNTFEVGDDFCILVDVAPDDGRPAREVIAALYARPPGRDAGAALDNLIDRTSAPIFSSDQFARLRREPSGWYVGKDGGYEGWLVYETRSGRTGQTLLIGAPWSTQALARQAADLTARAKP